MHVRKEFWLSPHMPVLCAGCFCIDEHPIIEILICSLQFTQIHLLNEIQLKDSPYTSLSPPHTLSLQLPPLLPLPGHRTLPGGSQAPGLASFSTQPEWEKDTRATGTTITVSILHYLFIALSRRLTSRQWGSPVRH